MREFEECTSEEKKERLQKAKNSFDELFSPDWCKAEERAKRKMKLKDPLCKCGEKLRYVGEVNKPDMNFVPLGGSYHTEGIWQCPKCKDIVLNPQIEWEQDLFTLTQKEMDEIRNKKSRVNRRR